MISTLKRLSLPYRRTKSDNSFFGKRRSRKSEFHINHNLIYIIISIKHVCLYEQTGTQISGLLLELSD